MEAQHKVLAEPTGSWRDARLLVTDVFEAPPVILRVGDSIVGTLGNFSASTGKAKSKKTFNVCAIVAAAMTGSTVLNYSASLPPEKRRIIYEIDDLGLVVIDGIRDLVHDINSPGESTDLITKLMQWTDERKIHIHTVLHLNKSDDNTRGHLGTELNNKAETVLQITKDDFDRDTSSVTAMHIRDRDFEPFAFRINADALPELVEDYQPRPATATKSFDYAEVSEAKHREALQLLFSEADRVSYSSLIGKLQNSYAAIGHSFGINKAKQLKVFLENKRMILKEEKFYRYNPDFHY